MMTLARLLRSFTRFRRVQPQVGRLHSAILRLSRGRIRRSRLLAGGQPVLVLTTTGRRSGSQRTTTVAYLRHGDGYAVTAMNLGSDRDPAWCLNLRAQPQAWIYVDGEHRQVRARQGDRKEAEVLWQVIINRLPTTANFRQLAQREIPIFVLEPTA